MTTRTAIKCLALAALCAAGPAAHAQAPAAGALENPPEGATVSGIGFIFGWHCSAGRIEVQLDAEPAMRAAQGTVRPDTAGVCGREDTGYGVTFNWARLSPGPHVIRAYADGVEFARKSFTVATYGAEFLAGRAATTIVNDFPAPGQSVVLEWREATQSFVMRELRPDAPALAGRWNGANLERRSNCRNADFSGDHGTYARFNIRENGAELVIDETTVTGLTCGYTGTVERVGNERRASGFYSCSDGKRGHFTARDFQVTPHELSISLSIKLDTTESCDIEAYIGGTRY